MTTDKDWWDKSRIIISGVATIVAIIGACLAYKINETINESNVKTKMIEVSISVLASPPVNETYEKEIRAWAIQVLAKYSKELGEDVALPGTVQDALKIKLLPQSRVKVNIFDSDIAGKRLKGTAGALEAE